MQLCFNKAATQLGEENQGEDHLEGYCNSPCDDGLNHGCGVGDERRAYSKEMDRRLIDCGDQG